MDEIRLKIEQASAAKPERLVASDDSLNKPNQGILGLTTEELTKLSRAVFTDFDLHEYAFHQKVLMDAKFFLERKLKHESFKPKIDLLPKDTKKHYLENPDKENPCLRMWLDLSFAWYKKMPSKKVLEKLVSDLNKEFNVERRFGLFSLEELPKGYSIYFDPNELNEVSCDYINSDRYLSRPMCSDTFDPLDRLNEDELFHLHMTNSLLETLQAKDPNSAQDPRFNIIRNSFVEGLQIWILDPSVKQDLIKEISDWNTEYNVEKRAGVFRLAGFDSYLGIWFQASIGNKGYEDLKKELLTDRAIANLEERFDIVFDNRSEWVY